MTLAAATLLLARPLWAKTDLDISALLVAVVIDLVAIAILVRWTYLEDRGTRRVAFFLVMANVAILLVTSLVPRLEFGLAFTIAVGLAGVVSIGRAPREMAYLLAATMVGLVNSSAFAWLPWLVVLGVDVAVVGLLFVMANILWPDRARHCQVRYDNLENLHRDRRAQLHWDLWERVGLDVLAVHVKEVDLAQGTADLDVRYKVSSGFQECVAQSIYSTESP